MAIKLSSVVVPLVFVALLTMVSPAQAGFSFKFGDSTATVSMGFTTEDFIGDSITRTDFHMGSVGIMGSAGITGSVAATETRRG